MHYLRALEMQASCQSILLKTVEAKISAVRGLLGHELGWSASLPQIFGLILRDLVDLDHFLSLRNSVWCFLALQLAEPGLLSSSRSGLAPEQILPVWTPHHHQGLPRRPPMSLPLQLLRFLCWAALACLRLRHLPRPDFEAASRGRLYHRFL